MDEQNQTQPQQEEQEGMSAQQASEGNASGQVEPHRGVVVLVLGILGLVVCFILGIVAWVMGNTDLQKMQAGQMDTAGEGLTKAGKICGMISVILTIVGVLIWIVVMGLGAVGAVFG